MIKLIAALTMLIDHIGVVLSPATLSYRVIGRLSMPLYAYCVARGFYYSNQHGTVKNYFTNMLILAIISQLPYYIITGGGWNICFTWVCSLLLLFVYTKEYDSPWKRVLSISIATFVIFIQIKINIFPVDYGISGVILPLLFYLLIINNKEGLMDYALTLIVSWAMFVFYEQSAGSIMQILSVPSALILAGCKRYDENIKLPKWLFYIFYPAHLTVLILIRSFF